MSAFKKIQKIDLNHLDDWFASTGYLYPVNELQLDRFNKLYQDYDFKLTSKRIDVKAIVTNTLSHSEIVFPWEDEIKYEVFDSLRMAARKGEKEIEQQIIDKMLSNHNKNSSSD